MTLTVKRSLERDDMQAVCEAVWERGKREIQRFGFVDPDQATNSFLGAKPEYGFGFFKNGSCVAAFGAIRLDGGSYRSYFLATEAFVSAAKEGTRLLRGLLREETAKRPGCRLECLSASDHPDSERWFKLLGFYSAEPLNGISRYIYGLTPPAKSAIFPLAGADSRVTDSSRNFTPAN